MKQVLTIILSKIAFVAVALKKKKKSGNEKVEAHLMGIDSPDKNDMAEDL